MKKKFLNHQRKKAWVMATLWLLFFVCLSFFITAIRPQEYRASFRILILQKQAVNFDPYTAAKSAEKIGKNLSKILSSAEFYKRVLLYGQTLSRLSDDPSKERKLWDRKISSRIESETSILTINVYDQNPFFSERWARAVLGVLEEQGSDFHGGGDFVTMTPIDRPLKSQYPVRPNMPLSLGLGALIGFVVGLWQIKKSAPKDFAALFPFNDFLEPPMKPMKEFRAVTSSPAFSFPTDPIRVHQTQRSLKPIQHVSEPRVEPIGQTSSLDYSNFQNHLKTTSKIIHELADHRPESQTIVHFPMVNRGA